MSVKMNTTDMPNADPAVATDFIPIDRGGTPRSLTPVGVKDYTIAQIEAIAAGGSVADGNGLFALQGGNLKPVDIDLVTQRAIDIVWGKAAQATGADANVLPLKDGATEKTITLAILAAYIRGKIEATILDVSTLDSASTLVGANNLLVVQGSTAKKTTITAINTAIYAGLKDHVEALTEATSVNDSDEMYIIQGGTARKTTVEALKSGVEDAVLAPPTTTHNKIPQWSATQKTLKDGLTLRTAVREIGSTDDASVPTEQAVRNMLGTTADEGIREVVVDGTFALGAIAGVAIATIPEGSHLKSIQANITVEAVTDGTTVRVGLGVDGDVDLYGLTGALTVNNKINTFMKNYDVLETDPAFETRNNTITWTREAIQLKAFPCADNGSIGDSAFTAGILRVRIAYDVMNELADV